MIQFTGNILIIDDDPNNRELVRRRLSKYGFTVLCAGSGSEALDFVKTKPVDLVLLDAGISDMPGIDVLKKLREMFTVLRLPIVAVTEKTDGSDTVAALLDAGANDYVTRPIDFPIVLASIQAQLEKKRTEEALYKSEERYRLAMFAANDGLWDWDLQTDKIYFSPRWKSLIG